MQPLKLKVVRSWDGNALIADADADAGRVCNGEEGAYAIATDELTAEIIVKCVNAYPAALAARDFMREELNGILEDVCLIDKGGKPRRDMIDELAVQHVEEYERILGDLDAALGERP